MEKVKAKERAAPNSSQNNQDQIKMKVLQVVVAKRKSIKSTKKLADLMRPQKPHPLMLMMKMIMKNPAKNPQKSIKNPNLKEKRGKKEEKKRNNKTLCI